MLWSTGSQRVRHDRATELNWTVAHQAPPPMGFSRKNTGVGSHFLLQGIFPTQGLKPRAPALQAESLPSEPPGKSMNTGVGSLPLLQGIFLTQELNRGLMHCRWIFHQLSYEGSTRILEWVAYPFSRGSS